MSQPITLQSHFAKILAHLQQLKTEGSSMSHILDYLFESLKSIIPFERLGIALLNDSADKLHLVWVRADIPVVHVGLSYTAPLENSRLKQVLEQGLPRVLSDLVEYLKEHPHSESTRLMIQDGIRSSMTCPLRIEGKTTGVVFFSSVSPCRYDESHSNIFIAIANELSLIIERSQLLEEREHARQQESRMRMVLHDFSSPLSAMQGFLELSQAEKLFENVSTSGQEVLKVLQGSTEYMLSLLNDLRELAHWSGPEAKSVLAEIDLNSFFRELILNAKSLARIKDISIVLKMSEAVPPKISADALLLRRALENLLTNAVKFSHRGTQVQVNVTAEQEELHIVVADEGQGIPKNEMGKLFLEFGKTSTRPTAGETSSGLGLAIVKRMTERMHGRVSVQSTISVGSEFGIHLPICISM